MAPGLQSIELADGGVALKALGAESGASAENRDQVSVDTGMR